MSGERLPIPENVAKEARVGIKLLNAGFAGGTPTGWHRARQLANEKTISVADLAVMRAWFARHGPDAQHAKNESPCSASRTGTSYGGYLKWLQDGAPISNASGKSKYRGAVAWLIWGGDAAYTWLKTNQVRAALESAYPKRASASRCNRLFQLKSAASFV